MKIRLSIDDACASDVRVADLAKKYEIETVFYWPVEWHSLAYDNGYEPLDILQAYMISQDFEIGSHTVTHRHLTKISELDAQKEIADSKFMLEAMFNKKITKFCPPRGYTNETLTDYTLSMYESQRLTKGRNLLHIHPDSGANGNIPWQMRFVHMIDEVDEIECWGHSWEFDKYDMWDELEEFLRENQYSQV